MKNHMTAQENITALMLILILGVFPLYFWGDLSTLPQAKMFFFLIAVSISAVLLIATSIYKHCKREERVMFSFSKVTLSFTDIAFLAFLIIALFSCIISPYPLGAFSGWWGRKQGLIMLIAYIVVYFIVSRQTLPSLPFLQIFFVSSDIVCFIALLNYLGMDPLRFFKDIDSKVAENFISVTGNINIFSSLCCLFLPAVLYMFSVAYEKKQRFFYGLSLFLASAGLTACNSDSAVITILLIFLWALLYFSKRAEYFYSFWKGTGIILLTLAFFLTLSTLIPSARSLKGLFKISYNFGIIFAAVLLWVVILFICKKNLPNITVSLRIHKIVSRLLMGAATIFAAYIIFASLVMPSLIPAPLNNYLIFDSHWGHNRAAEYKQALYIYNNFDIPGKLLGCGPDTYGLLIWQQGGREAGLKVTDTAHCEFIQYLITTGLLGLLSYIAFFSSLLYKGIRSVKDPAETAILLSLVAYIIQSFSGIAQSSTTPLFFTMTALLGGIVRRRIRDSQPVG